MNPNFRNFALWVIIFLLVLALVTLFNGNAHRGTGTDIAYSQLLSDAEQWPGHQRGDLWPGRVRHLFGRPCFHHLRTLGALAG